MTAKPLTITVRRDALAAAVTALLADNGIGDNEKISEEVSRFFVTLMSAKAAFEEEGLRVPPCSECREHGLERIDHPANAVDWKMSDSGQGYQVYRCRACGDYWGCRWQWDAVTGSDDRWHRFGPNIDDVKRHC